MLKGIEGISTYAKDVDEAAWVVFIIVLFLFVITIGSMLYFLYKYRASKNPPEKAKNIKHYTPIEVTWTVIPSILMGIVFYYGLQSLRVQRTMPKDADAIIIKVLAQRWSWNFEYSNGKKSPELYIPVNKNIKLQMTAPINDVLHSFYVPAFRAKEDIIPGQITKVWFNATTKGEYDIQCAEYCGTRHSFMRSKVIVVDEEEYNEWLNPTTKAISTQPKGLEYIEQYGCTACHTLDGTVLVAPTFKDLYNRQETVITNDQKRTITVDEDYLKNSILHPNKDVVEGFMPNIMPPFDGVIKEEELKEIITYLKGENKEETIQPKKEINGLEVMQNSGCLGCHSIDGSAIIGPTLKGVYQRQNKIKRDKQVIEITNDETYIKNSILNPKSDVVEGYPNIMPSFENILKEDEVDAIVQYLKTLK